ncbi:hypothetical protein [Janthinobacterium sp. HH01]|uniref:hypothetical protein n=1 Tax=Janthinobacterium sp. HH01 TaxID=1198452 RepID=UPI001267F478|nr:hypothetical protein [Janthinobacterium sp. HH01]
MADAAGSTASAAALPERTGGEAEKVGLVPHIAHVSAAQSAPINKMGLNPVSAEADEETENWSAVSEEHLGEVSLVMTDSGKTKTVPFLTHWVRRAMSDKKRHETEPATTAMVASRP